MSKIPTELDKIKAEYFTRNLVEDKLWEKIEFRPIGTQEWESISGEPSFISIMEYRWKKDTIIVNGIEVPAPVKVDTLEYDSCYYIVATATHDLCCQVRGREAYARKALQRGTLHSTKEAAIAHAEAMLAPSRHYMMYKAKP